jgi:hypothetical protein
MKSGHAATPRSSSEESIGACEAGCESNGLWLLKNSQAQKSQKQNCATMPHASTFGVRLDIFYPPIPDRFNGKMEFFNRHA